MISHFSLFQSVYKLMLGSIRSMQMGSQSARFDPWFMPFCLGFVY